MKREKSKETPVSSEEEVIAIIGDKYRFEDRDGKRVLVSYNKRAEGHIVRTTGGRAIVARNKVDYVLLYEGDKVIAIKHRRLNNKYLEDLVESDEMLLLKAQVEQGTRCEKCYSVELYDAEHGRECLECNCRNKYYKKGKLRSTYAAMNNQEFMELVSSDYKAAKEKFLKSLMESKQWI